LTYEIDEDEDDEEEEEATPQDGEKMLGAGRNSQLTVGYKGDRSYVVRGNNIGVFNTEDGDNLSYYATISKIATPDGKSFEPKHVSVFCILK
jgi:hypothetical protein